MPLGPLDEADANQIKKVGVLGGLVVFCLMLISSFTVGSIKGLVNLPNPNDNSTQLASTFPCLICRSYMIECSFRPALQTSDLARGIDTPDTTTAPHKSFFHHMGGPPKIMVFTPQIIH